VGEVLGCGERRPFAVVAGSAGGDEVVEAVVAAVAPGNEVIDLPVAGDGLLAVEAGAVLEVEESLSDSFERDSVAAEQEVFELDD
jgi:hypothetical protein